MTRKDRIKALFRLAPGIEISGFDALEITGFWPSYQSLMALEKDGFLTSRWEDVDDGREHRRRLYRLADGTR